MQAQRVEGKNGISYRAQFMVKGERYTVTRRLKSQAEAEAAKLAKDIRDKKLGRIVSKKFGDALLDYAAKPKQDGTPRTVKFIGELKTLAKQLPDWATRNVDDITEEDV